jgi:hypothetical protein
MNNERQILKKVRTVDDMIKNLDVNIEAVLQGAFRVSIQADS